MTKKTKMWLAFGAGALVLGGGGYYLYKRNKSAASTPAQLPPGTPVSTLVNGLRYTIAALVPSYIKTQDDLQSSLTAAGWSNVTVNYFLGDGNKGSFPISNAGYVATGTWSGAGGSAVPPGVVAAQVA